MPSSNHQHSAAGPNAFILLQYLLPHHLLSRIVLFLTRRRWRPFKNFLIRTFLRHFDVNLQEAVQTNATAYDSFNTFFTRALKPGMRPITSERNAVVSPADGALSEIGSIDGARVMQAKGRDYTLETLVGADLAAGFHGGEFATVYLAPHNYHRVHMPCAGRLVGVRYIPGRLFSVNAATAARVPDLFARNERVVCLFEGDAGRFAVILVGALFVGSMSTVWAGDITPAARRKVTDLPVPAGTSVFERGAELGRFNMGSTVILLFQPGRIKWDAALTAGTPLRMGQTIGRKQ